MRIYKGSDKIIRIPKPGIPKEHILSATVLFYTDNRVSVKKELSEENKDFIVTDNDFIVFLHSNEINLFNEGVLQYSISYQLYIDCIDEAYNTVAEVQTDYFIKNTSEHGETEQGNIGELQEEITALKAERDTLLADIANKDAVIAEKDRLLEMADGEAERAYENGMAYQKNQLASTNINTNGTYTREDGWNEVNVNVPNTLDTSAMFHNMVTKMCKYEYLSFYTIMAEGDEQTYTIPEDSVAVVSTMTGLELTRMPGTYNIDNQDETFIALYSHNKEAGIETSVHVVKKVAVMFNAASRLFGLNWDTIHLYNTDAFHCSGRNLFCHTMTPPTLTAVPVGCNIYYPKGADYSAFIEQWGNDTTISPIDYENWAD